MEQFEDARLFGFDFFRSNVLDGIARYPLLMLCMGKQH
jgi:hypothetical protein